MEAEKWADIVGYPYYQVSTYGRVRSKRAQGSWGMLRDDWYVLKQSPTGNGYLRVHLGKLHPKRTHILVLEAFVGPRPKDMEASHLDGNRRNNHLSNLRWETHQQNMDRKFKHGTVNHSQRHGMAALTDAEVVLMREMYAAGGITQKELADMFGICAQEYVSRILAGKKWKGVGGPLATERDPATRRGRAVLTENDVRYIRSATGISKAALARKYGVSHSVIRNVISRKTWSHVA